MARIADAVNKVYTNFGRPWAALGYVVKTTATSVLSSDPAVGAGSGAAAESEPNGSLWLRTDGGLQYRAGSAWETVVDRADSNTAAGTALTNSTTETVLDSYSIPASRLVQGSVLRFRAKVKVTANASTTTLTVRARLGGTTLTGTVLVATAATDTAANDIVYIEGELIARAAPGASAAIEGCGIFCEPAAAGGALKTWSLDATNFATNAILLLEVTGEWSAADANSCQLEHLAVQIG